MAVTETNKQREARWAQEDKDRADRKKRLEDAKPKWTVKTALKAAFGTVGGSESVLKAEIEGGDVAAAANEMTDAELGVAIGMAIAVPVGLRASSVRGRAGARSSGGGGRTGRGDYTRTSDAGTSDMLNPQESGTGTGVASEGYAPNLNWLYGLKNKPAGYAELTLEEVLEEAEEQGNPIPQNQIGEARSLVDDYNKLTDLEKAEKNASTIEDQISDFETNGDTAGVNQAKVRLEEAERQIEEYREFNRAKAKTDAISKYETDNNLTPKSPIEYLQDFKREFGKIPIESELDEYIKDYNEFRIDRKKISTTTKRTIDRNKRNTDLDIEYVKGDKSFNNQFDLTNPSKFQQYQTWKQSGTTISFENSYP